MPVDWAQGEPWLTIPAKDVSTMVNTLWKLHHKHLKADKATISTAQDKWYRKAPGDRENFKMIPESSLDNGRRWTSGEWSQQYTQKRTGYQPAEYDRTARQKTQRQWQAKGSKHAQEVWHPGQSASSGAAPATGQAPFLPLLPTHTPPTPPPPLEPLPLARVLLPERLPLVRTRAPGTFSDDFCC